MDRWTNGQRGGGMEQLEERLIRRWSGAEAHGRLAFWMTSDATKHRDVAVAVCGVRARMLVGQFAHLALSRTHGRLAGVAMRGVPRTCKKNFCWTCMELTGGEGQPTSIKYAHWRGSNRKNKCLLWPPKKKNGK